MPVENSLLYEEYYLVGYDVVQSARSSTFWRNILPPSSGSKMQQAVCIAYISLFSALFTAFVLPVAWLTLWPRRWRHHIPLKHNKLLPNYCSITYQKIVLFITSVRTSDPVFCVLLTIIKALCNILE
jgi:hypothetical protein